MSAEAPVLATTGLSVSLGGRAILKDIAMKARHGEFLVVIGPNGAGKTTLLKALAGLLDASGEVLLGGRSLALIARRQRALLLGYLPQGHEFHWPLSVLDVVGLGRLPRGAGADLSEEDRNAVARAMEETGVSGFAGRTVTTLSGGERARVALARVLATEADLILADEPTASLDPRYQLVVLDILKRHAARGAVVAVLHDLGLAARYADRLLILDEGRVVAAGPPREVLTAERLATTFGVRAEILERDGATVVIPKSVI
ncbi:ABC transporter ATP-binding protein [Bauldia litoralis]|uniref:Iron complex transport system ATP-binding protein n=1 Tax=Bauldia litoralis TaxID=665467 RepID=A0A1G6DA30_9HYPH|nr:ABC transporter ATP-binding protein [Bauldia litoralis]SDB42044.1 iron complex transport system ATP-binding protein [Bauldia litoralis]